ncbi:MAG TPA: CRISPR-associated helicase Cas3' [Candidatus Binataceae bacterium]|nr:CRISPR-associated helicase Cas3' [Candidatus Binataceae bacterium]
MKGFPTDFWGKLAANDAGVEWHPLIDHCADVAAVCDALLRLTLIRKRLAALGERADLIESDIQRLSALAAFHDAGKFNLGFQNKADRNRRPQAGHVQPILDLFGASGSIEYRRLRDSMPLDEIQSWADDDSGLDLLVAAIAHHGRPVEVGGNPDREVWRPGRDGRDPFAGIARLTDKVRQWFPAAFTLGAQPLPSQSQFQHAFCGLVTLADWIGSDRAVFRFSETGDPERIGIARHLAHVVLGRIGLDSTAARAAYQAKPREFSEIFGFEPNLAQRRILELPLASDGGLAILESETGSGKTEAALVRFFRLFDAGLVDGMYFALPTRTAAVQMHRRIANAIDRAFPDESARPPVILAVPGYLPLDDQPDARRMAPFETLYPDDEAARWRFRRWAGEHPKRYLAGAISIGTVDQALLSALMVSHSHLRATSLLRQFLIVDEVHASDSYMATILREVLRFHLAAGGHAMLLSATLGSRAAIALTSLGERAARKPPPLVQAEKLPYPSLTTVDSGRNDTVREPLISESQPKTVTVELAPIAGDFTAVAARAIDAALAGARMLIVRNTVRDCVDTQLALERIAGARSAPNLLFAVNDRPAPHHARFAREDRALLDHRLEERFGKNSAAPCVLAATQTVQQSLDIDADLMLTDLCPIDVMLQRIGRLHRHRRDRPEPFRAARVIVLTPADRDLTPLIGRSGAARGDHGFGTVYEDLRVLEATWRALEAAPTLEIPAMNRRLVEAVTHPDALKAIAGAMGDPWKKHARHIDGQTIAAKGLAGLNCVNRDEPFSDCRFPPSLETRISARLGEDDRIVEFPNPIPGPFGPPICRLTLPGWLAKGAPADAKPENIIAEAGALRFNFADRAFIYDRLGLRPAETPSNPEEDLADA